MEQSKVAPLALMVVKNGRKMTTSDKCSYEEHSNKNYKKQIPQIF